MLRTFENDQLGLEVQSVLLILILIVKITISTSVKTSTKLNIKYKKMFLKKLNLVKIFECLKYSLISFVKIFEHSKHSLIGTEGEKNEKSG
jgi:hypothetical protein